MASRVAFKGQRRFAEPTAAVFNLRHRRPAAGALSNEFLGSEWTLLRRAGCGDVRAVERLWDLHGSALVSMACLFAGDREAAASIVVDTVAEACARPGILDRTGTVRHQLAHLAYLTSLTQPATGPQHDTGIGIGNDCLELAESSRWSAQQRASVALVAFGDYTYREVADLLGLPAVAVARLLTDAMRLTRRMLGRPGSQ